MVEITETLKLQIYPTEEQIELFQYSQLQFIKGCQCVSDYIFEHQIFEQRKLHDTLYYYLREKFGLPAQLAASTFRVVLARYKTVQTQLRKQQVKFLDKYTNEWVSYRKELSHLTQPIQFKQPVLQLVRNRSYSFLKDNTLSIGTLSGRQKVPFTYLDNHDYFDKFSNYTFGQGELLNIKGKWYFHVSATIEAPDFDVNNIQHVVGIDRGLRHLAVTFDEQGKTTFYNGKHVMNKRKHYSELRAELQSKGTKSAKKRLKRLSRKENRWMRDVNHRITKTLIDTYGPNTLFVLENLEGVTFNTVHHRKKSKRYEHHSWAFYQFEEFLTYKAKEIGAKVIKIDPRYTSQTCPKCGNIDKTARDHHVHEYHCKQCGYRSNDDRIAAMNIQAKGKQWITEHQA